jgi:hypothetical protein
MEPVALPLEDDPALELKLRTWAVPLALGVAWLLVKTGPGHMLLRIFCSMWVHELGHALTAWLCGFLAVPGPWLTLTGSNRSIAFAVLLSSALIFATVRWWLAGRRGLAGCAAVLLAVQLGLTLLLRPESARALIVFGGDGGCLVLGALLMASVYAPAEGMIRRGWLRWGFLAIGAAAFADVFEQWWAARTDPDRIPFGMNEGVGPSDPSVLSDTYGWSATLLVQRYVLLGCVCLLALVCLYAAGRAQARRQSGVRPQS